MARVGARDRADEQSVRIPLRSGDTLRVIVRRGGDGVPFLLVHGLASNARLWDDVAARLADRGHDSVAVDQRGHGESQGYEGGFDFFTLAGDLADVVDATVQRPVIAAGQSWGANVVLEFAGLFPHLAAGACLVDGGFIKLSDGFQDWDAAATALAPPTFDGVTLAELETGMRRRLTGFSESGVAAQLANFTANPDGTVRSRLARSHHMTILRHLWDHDPDAVGAMVTAPIHVIAVDGGRPAKPDRVEQFAATCGATVTWAEGHHDIHAEQPELVASVLVDLAARAAT